MYLVVLEKIGESILDGLVTLKAIPKESASALLEMEIFKAGYSSVRAKPDATNIELEALMEKQTRGRYGTAYATGVKVFVYLICEGGDARQREYAFFEDKDTVDKVRLRPAAAPEKDGDMIEKRLHRVKQGELLMCRKGDFSGIKALMMNYATNS
jgi:hypothetical protein